MDIASRPARVSISASDRSYRRSRSEPSLFRVILDVRYLSMSFLQHSVVDRRAFLRTVGAAGISLGTLESAACSAAHFPPDGNQQPSDHVLYGWDVQSGYHYHGVTHGLPVPAGKVVTPANFFERPFNEYAFQNTRTVFDHVKISRGEGDIARLPVKPMDDFISNLKVLGTEGEAIRFEEHLERFHTNAIVILHDGAIVTERYFKGMHPHTPHYFASMSRSLCACVVVNLIAQNRLSRHTCIADYLPAFRQTDWREVTIDHALKMISGIRYTFVSPEDLEDYKSGGMTLFGPKHQKSNTDVAREWRSLGFWKRLPTDDPRLDITDLLKALQRAAPPGTLWSYSNADTNILAEVCREVTGRDMDQLLSEHIWSRLGAEADAVCMRDSHGKAWGPAGISATLRDTARFAQMLLDGGRYNGQEIVPREWVRTLMTDHVQDKIREESSIPRSKLVGNEGRSFNDHFWIWWNGGPRGAFAAQGAGGQSIYVHPDHRTVIVKFSSCPISADTTARHPEFHAFRKIAESLAS
jgi:CubicO group peptidase (beta-lactamase class C family)